MKGTDTIKKNTLLRLLIKVINLIIEIYIRIIFLGRKPICNFKHERAPRFGKLCFPLCWRCSGVIFGFYISFKSLLIADVSISFYTFFIGLLLIMPTAYDGVKQNFFYILSNNKKRFITGFIAGIGIGIIVTSIL